MSNISYDLSGKIDRAHIEALYSIKTIADSLNISFFIIGASARDYLFEHCHRMTTLRKTQDIDLGVEVADWERFDKLTNSLIATGGFKASSTKHRVLFEDLIIDIVPFGANADEHKKISWPPEHEVMMSLLGFQEAYECSITIRLSSDPQLDVKVATLPGLALMKLISWKEQYPNRPKDAEDLLFLMKKYGDAGNADRLYGEKQTLMEEEGFDIELAGTRLLGQDMATIADPDTLKQITAILEEETQEQSRYHLVTDMLRGTLTPEDKFDKVLLAVEKLKQGTIELKNQRKE